MPDSAGSDFFDYSGIRCPQQSGGESDGSGGKWMDSETNMGQNMGFVFNSRWFDLAVTLICTGLGVAGLVSGHEGLTAFSVPAAIGLFRQAVPLLTFVYVLTIGLAMVMTYMHLDSLAYVMDKIMA